ncbi:MAG: aspartate kinase [Rubinisphaera brasiliensis]|uniref:aspartate kinase n=1 Tax=Rubinisphaera brasiliensis (strain ATCC 49424 / DSM 5305 / JCM 21570 / IAM 15109 / NBRC 103401 / IFAM 1448) TaxID=756272 RepID=F0SP55_RUBBR|nr:aspartate kinase [Rubinisphaera brasiliensis DSM 5305]MBR9802430.1 aspartate kinase [bacterium]
MSIIVQKFGGTSVATAEKIRNAARRAIAAKSQGHQVVVVVSARGKKTDELVDLAAEITETPTPREMDVLLSTGEQETIALLSMAIHKMGEKAVSLTGTQIGIITDNASTKARIKKIATKKMHDYLDDGHIVIAAGFQGCDEDGNITTLGRGGSDTTATALAAVLKASMCEIYTDVEGVFTTDPRIVGQARKIPQLSYDEMLELASLGAGVMHSRSVEFAKKYRVPLRVRPSFSDGIGTLISQKGPEPLPVVTGVALVKDELRVSIKNLPDRPGVMSFIFSKMAARKIPIDLVVQDIAEEGTAGVTFTVPRADFADALTAASSAVEEIGQGTVAHGTELSKLSIVGSGMATHTGVAAQMFQTLADHEINIMMISTGDIKISVLIRSDRALDAVQAIHESFHLDKQENKTPTIGFQHASEPDIQVVSDDREQEVVLGLANMEDIVVSDVLVDTSQARVTIEDLPDRPGIAAKVFKAVAEGGIMVDMIVQNVSEEEETNITFTIPRDDLEQCLLLVREVIGQSDGAALSYDAEIAKISVAGIGLRSHTGVGDKLFKALADNDINVLMVGTSEVRMTAIVKKDHAARAEEALKKSFAIQ